MCVETTDSLTLTMSQLESFENKEGEGNGKVAEREEVKVHVEAKRGRVVWMRDRVMKTHHRETTNSNSRERERERGD